MKSLADVLAKTPPVDLHCQTLEARFVKEVMQSSDILKHCVVKTQDKNMKEDREFEGLRESHKLLKTELQPCRCKNFSSLIESEDEEVLRRVIQQEYQSKNPNKPIAFPHSCSLIVQKMIHRLLPGKCQRLANYAPKLQLNALTEIQMPKNRGNFRHFLFECRRPRTQIRLILELWLTAKIGRSQNLSNS